MARSDLIARSVLRLNPRARRPDVAPERALDVRPGVLFVGRRGRRGSVERAFEKHGQASVPPQNGPPFYSR